MSMFRIQESIRSRTEVIGPSSLIFHPVPRPSATPVSVRDRFQTFGPGRVLADTPMIHLARPLDARSEQVVRRNLQNLIEDGYQKKIQQLIDQMRALFPLGNRREFETWLADFVQLNFNQMEDRALSLALLIIQVIRPALVNGATLEQQEQLFRWENAIHEILQQMLPGVLIEDIIKKCEDGLVDKRVFEALCARADVADEAQRTALSHISEAMAIQMQENCSLIKRRLISLQSSRREIQQTVAAEMEELVRKVEQISEQFLQHESEIEELGREGNELARRLRASIDECKELLRRFS